MFILAALLLILALWVWVSPAWAPTPPNLRGIGSRAERVSESAAQKGKQWYSGVRGRLKFRNDKQDLTRRFRQWTTESEAARARLTTNLPEWTNGFSTWLRGLSDREAVEFSQDVAQFCASQNFNIAWLNDPQVSSDPQLKQAVEDAVLLYGVAWWRADQVQSDVQAVLRLKAFLAAPNKRENKAFGQELFSGLVAKKLVIVPSSLMTASEKERLYYMTRSIEQISQRHPDEFSQVLRRVVTSEARPSSAPAAPTGAEVAPSGGAA